jgi:hypothetical protein
MRALPHLALALSLAAALAPSADAAPRTRKAEAPAPITLAEVEKSASPPAPQSGGRREGKVLQVTPARIYLDAGTAEGLAVGQKVTLRRGAAAAGACTIDHVGDHRASCTGAAARAGDTFALTPPPPVPGKAPLPKPQPAAEVARERQALQAGATSPVEYHGTAEAFATPLRASATLSHRSWLSGTASAWHDERIDARLGVPISDFGYFDLDATAVHLTRPDGDRFRPGTPNQLYVWRAELALRQPSATGTGFSGSLGRLIPATAPGAPRIDGAQVSYRLSGGEIGLFGGGIPDAQTLAPGFDRQTAGLFFSLGRSGDRDGALSYSQATARVAYVKAPELGTRFEAEMNGLAQLWRTLDLSASLRLASGDNAAPALIDAARVGFDLRPSEGFTLSGAFRYVGEKLVSDPVGLVGNGVLLEGQSRHADLAGTFVLSPGATLGVEGGLAQDVNSATTRGWAGPTLALPQLFGASGGLALGYHEELGDLPGRATWVQTSLFPARTVQFTARLSVFMDSRKSGGFDDLEAGLYLRVLAKLTDHIAAHFSAMGRLQPVAAQVVPSPLPYGAWIDAGISGDL